MRLLLLIILDCLVCMLAGTLRRTPHWVHDASAQMPCLHHPLLNLIFQTTWFHPALIPRFIFQSQLIDLSDLNFCYHKVEVEFVEHLMTLI